MNAEQASKQVMWELTRLSDGEGRCSVGVSRATEPHRSHRGIGDGMHDKETDRNTGSPCGEGRDPQPATREGQAGSQRVTDRPVVVTKSGNAGGAKGP